MTPEQDALLRSRYPKIFKPSEFNDEPLDTWGFECGPGWFELIDTLCNSIQHHIDLRLKNVSKLEEQQQLQVVAQQVKEKFGGLRFYATGGDDITNAYIDLAESLSMKICESCGNAGKRQSVSGWIHTACDPCFENRTWRKTP